MGVVYRATDPDLDRELAIKVVQPGSRSKRAQERLLEEARAMAKLRHPSVVPVFDVGTTENGVFIVMPLINGGTMYDWMREPHEWREVVERFVSAGRGLAAAHAAGLVHRDFKPRNVLLGTSGEVLVADFGIAARTDDSIDRNREASTPGSAQVSSIAGTPAYMAPEQADGGTIDARADQYSFCISFWEALCGQRPTEAETRTGSTLPRPALSLAGKRRNTPGWLLEAVARGFSASPNARWPSMNALIEHLERRLGRPKRLVLGASVLALAGITSAAVLFARGRSEDPCPDPGPRIATVWSQKIQGEIEQAFAATGVPYAGDMIRRITPVLSRYASSWRTTHIAACKAARVERTQSDLLFERRRHCLERRFAALSGRVDAFKNADRNTVDDAVRSVETLPPIEECDDAESLLAFTTPIPSQHRTRIAELDREIDQIEAMEARGVMKERLDPTQKVVEASRALGYAPLHARALWVRGKALEDNAQPAEAAYRELVQVAAEARDDTLVVHGWISIIDDLAGRQNKVAEAKALEPVAEAALVRAGATPLLRYRLESALATRAMAGDEYDVVLDHGKKAVEAASTVSLRASAQANLGSWLANMGRNKDALPYFEQALRSTEEALGPNHPDTAERLLLVSQALARTGGSDGQEALVRRALDIQKHAFGPDAPPVGRTLLHLGNLLRSRGSFKDAVPILSEAVSILEKGSDQQQLGFAIGALGDATYGSEGFDAAKPHYLRAMAILEAVGGKDQLPYVMTESNFANRYFDAGDCASARPYYEHAARFLTAQKHRGAVMATSMLAQCDLKDGKIDAALATLEDGVRVCRENGCSPGALEGLLYTLGGQLVDTKRDRPRGISLVREARAGWKKMGNTQKVQTVDDWLAKRRIAPE